jgi:hypothetical protein
MMVSLTKRMRFVSGVMLALTVTLLSALAGPALAQEGDTVFVVDLDTAAAGVQDTRSAAVGEEFHMRVALASFGGSSWGAYQISMEFDESRLEITGLPESWRDDPTESAGGNVATFTSGALCDPSPASAAVGPEPGQFAMTCAEENFDDVVAMTSGDLVDIVVRCIAPGDASLTLSTADNTFLLDTRELSTTGAQVLYSDAREGATVACAGEALTPTPGGAPPTTPGIITTITAVSPGTPVVGPDTTPGQGATPDGSVVPPGGTETDDDDDDDSSTLPILIGIIVAVLVLGAGGAALLLRRRS